MNPLARGRKPQKQAELPQGASRQQKRKLEREAQKLREKQRHLNRPLTHPEMLDIANGNGADLVRIAAAVDAPVCLTFKRHGEEAETGLVLATSDPEMSMRLLVAVEAALEDLGKLTTWPSRTAMSERIAAKLAEDQRIDSGIALPGDPGFSVPAGGVR